MRQKDRQACLYVVELEHAGDYWIKVGLTNCRGSRFSSLQNGCPIDFSRIFYANIHNDDLLELAEAVAHVALRDRAHRAEWFRGQANRATLGEIAVACALHGIGLEWEEYSRSGISTAGSIKRAETILSRQRQKREERAEGELEYIREQARAPLSMQELSAVYGRPTLKLKSR